MREVDVEVLAGCRAIGLDLGGRRVRLDDGTRLPFDLLVIASGSRARRLGDDPDELVLRTLDDALLLRDRLAGARSLLVLGGGFLGMEVASVVRARGIDVTVVDVRPPLIAVLGGWLASRLTDAARQHGVRLVVSSPGVERLDATTVRLGDGTRLHADLVVSAVGDVPNVEWLAASGLEIRGGVVVDSRCRAADGVVAAGDVAVFPAPDGTVRRMPYWDNALAQARAAVAALLLGDVAPPYRPGPYYWTEAFGISLKIAGPLPVTGDPTVLEGSPQDGAALLRWDDDGDRATVVALNHRITVGRLRRLAVRTHPSPIPVPSGDRR